MNDNRRDLSQYAIDLTNIAPWKFKDFDHDPNVPDQHIEDRMASKAVSFIEKHKDEPFFLNYGMFSVHAPFDANDIGEKNNLENANPERVQQIAALSTDFFADTKAVTPIRNPNFDPARYRFELEGIRPAAKKKPKPNLNKKPKQIGKL